LVNQIYTYNTLETSMNGTGVVASRRLVNPERDVIKFYGQDLRPSRGSTGVHGKLELFVNDELVVFDNFNFEKLAQRKSFAGEAFKDGRLRALSEYYNREDLNTDLTSFTYDAWPIWVEGKVEIKRIEGNPWLEVGQYVRNYVVKGGGTIMNAQPKQGKSFIAMAMAVSVDAGVNELWEVEKAKTLYINLERSEASITKRLGGINTALGLNPSRALDFMNIRGSSLSDSMDTLRKKIKDEDIRFIVVDSISRAGMGSLTEDGPALKITDELNSLVEETDRAWLGIAHRGWSNEHVFGSIHFLSACDVMVDIKSAHNKATKELGVQLSVSGNNDLPPSDPSIIGLSFDPQGVTQMSKATLDDFPELKEENQSNKERILTFLKDNGGVHSQIEIAEGTGVPENSVYVEITRMGKAGIVEKVNKKVRLKQ